MLEKDVISFDFHRFLRCKTLTHILTRDSCQLAWLLQFKIQSDSFKLYTLKISANLRGIEATMAEVWSLNSFALMQVPFTLLLSWRGQEGIRKEDAPLTMASRKKSTDIAWWPSTLPLRVILCRNELEKSHLRQSLKDLQEEGCVYSKDLATCWSLSGKEKNLDLFGYDQSCRTEIHQKWVSNHKP